MICRNPFIFLGHFNLCPVCLEPSEDCRNPFIFLGHFNQINMMYMQREREKSQSLHFLRAFQPLKGGRAMADLKELRRNPFIFLGHFNFPAGKVFLRLRRKCRNPFIFLGHFNFWLLRYARFWAYQEVAIPSFSQGISTMYGLKQKLSDSVASQSLHFLRAFQQIFSYGVRQKLADCRNPFIFLGHFNKTPVSTKV